MIRQLSLICICLLVVLAGCHPTQPFYVNESGDLSNYLDQDTSINDPDYEQYRLAEVEQSLPPVVLSNPELGKDWNITLEECLSIALHNSKIIRLPQHVSASGGLGAGLVGTGSSDIAQGSGAFQIAGATSVYDPGIVDTDQNGVHTALSNFDAQVTTNLFWQKNERPQNVVTGTLDFPDVLLQDQAQADINLIKPTAYGTQFRLGSQTVYDQNNRGFGRAQPSDWLQAFEFEVTHPIFRGRGTQVNRAPVIIARINTDLQLSGFQAQVRNMVFDTEKAYWILHRAYRELETAKIGRNAAQQTWKLANDKLQVGKSNIQEASQAEEQYYFFKSRVQTAWRNLLNAESNLRWLMGIAPTDNRVLRPIEEPLSARMHFEWRDALTEMLARRAELLQQKWRIKQDELQLILARNQLLPQVNVVALYRWLGLGDDFAVSDRRGFNFPRRGSLAWDELTEGRYSEWRIGIDVTPPRIGARREHAAVRNAELRLIRDKERLREMELAMTHSLTQTLREMDAQYNLAQTHFNRWRAAEKEAESVMALFPEKLTIDRLLDAQRRRADAQLEYYNAISEYSIQVAHVHYRKGSLLDTHNIQLAEGPWPKKAYFDAMGRARQRSASQYMNYGWTRPNVVSRGAIQQAPGQAVQGEDVPPPQQPTPAEPQKKENLPQPKSKDGNAAAGEWRSMIDAR